MKSNSIPNGEPGSINDLAKRSLEDRDSVVMELIDKSVNVVFNVVDCLTNHVGMADALEFLTTYVKLKFNK